VLAIKNCDGEKKIEIYLFLHEIFSCALSAMINQLNIFSLP